MEAIRKNYFSKVVSNILKGFFFLCLFLFKKKYLCEHFCCSGVHLFHRDFDLKSEKAAAADKFLYVYFHANIFSDQ